MGLIVIQVLSLKSKHPNLLYTCTLDAFNFVLLRTCLKNASCALNRCLQLYVELTKKVSEEKFNLMERATNLQMDRSNLIYFTESPVGILKSLIK